MALNVPSFDDLRESNEQALKRAGYFKDPTELNPKQEGRIQALLGARQEIEDFASTQPQREDYGIEQWNQDFVRLRDIPEQKIRDAVWTALPNCRFKRFQEAFCYSHQLIVPPYSIDDRGGVSFRGINVHTLSLQGCLVSPDRITGTIAESLHLVDDSETKGDPLARIRLRQLECINRLKEVFESAHSVQRGHQRVFVVHEPSDAVASRYENEQPVDQSVLGHILYFRGRVSGDTNPFQQRTVQVFDSAFAADRKTTHEEHEYDAEVTMLASLEQQLDAFNRRLDVEWKRPAARDGLRSEAQQLLAGAADALGSCENIYKVEAQGMLEAAALLKDTRGRENVSVVMAKTVGAIRRLQSRLTEMMGKGGFNQSDAYAIERAIRRDEERMRSFRSAVAEAPSKMHAFEQLFGDAPLSPSALEASAAGFRRVTHVDFALLDRVQLSPFRQFSVLLAQQEGRLQDALLMRDSHKTEEAFLRMHVIGKFQEIETVFQRIAHEIINPHISVEHVRDEIAKLRLLFTAYQMLPGHTVPELVAPYEEMKSRLMVMEQQLNRYAEQHLDRESKTLMYGRLRKYIRSLNIPGVAQSMA